MTSAQESCPKAGIAGSVTNGGENVGSGDEGAASQLSDQCPLIPCEGLGVSFLSLRLNYLSHERGRRRLREERWPITPSGNSIR